MTKGKTGITHNKTSREAHITYYCFMYKYLKTHSFEVVAKKICMQMSYEEMDWTAYWYICTLKIECLTFNYGFDSKFQPSLNDQQ